MTFYQRYVMLCSNIGKSPSAVALENGFSKASVNHWKIGRANPTDLTLSKLANYFGVSVEYLKGEAEEPEEIKKDPALDVKTDTENKVSDLGSVALNIIHKLKPELQEDALAYLLELSARQRASEGKE